MHKNTRRTNAPYILEELYPGFVQRPDEIKHLVVDAVTQYNRMSQLSEYFEGEKINERLIDEADEEAAKVFLDGIFDIMERKNR